MSVRNFLLILAIASVISFMMAQTASIFAGQHVWYNLSSGNDVGGQIPCEKCHADVAEEMSLLLGPHTGETGYGRMECEFCHRTFWFEEADDVNQTIYNRYFYTYAQVNYESIGVQPGKEAHAASTIPCMYCHSGAEWGWYHSYRFTNKACSCHGTADTGSTGDWREYYYHGDRFFTGCAKDDPNCPVPATQDVPGECIKCHGTGDGSTHGPIYIPPAGGFGLTTNASDTGRNASHLSFVLSAIENEMMEDANEACIACHTKMRVEIWFNVTTEAKITVNNSYNRSYSYWDVEAITPSNYTTYKEVKGE